MIPLHEPQLQEADFAIVNEALRSNWVSTGGPFVDLFEKEFAAFVGRRFAVSTCNGTVAIQLMIEALRRQREVDGPFDVIVPNLSFIATANAVVHAGGTPIFSDCAPRSLNMGSASVASILEHYRRDADGSWRSRAGRPLLAIMPAHIMGWLGESAKLADMARGADIALLEDAAESLGTRGSDEAHSGGAGLAAAFSFNGNKILTTGGGGMVVTDDEAFAKRVKHLSTTAKTDGLRYFHDEVGYNFRLVNVLAALGVSQLRRLPDALRRKDEIARVYERLVSERLVGQARVYAEQGIKPNNWLVNLVFENPGHRERALDALVKEGVMARPLWAPFHLQAALAKYAQPLVQWPNAQWIWERSLSVPSSPHISDADIELVVEKIERALR